MCMKSLHSPAMVYFNLCDISIVMHIIILIKVCVISSLFVSKLKRSKWDITVLQKYLKSTVSVCVSYGNKLQDHSVSYII